MSDLRSPLTAGERLRLDLMDGGAALLARLGFTGLSRLGSGLGRLMWLALPSRRRLATDNIRHHLHLPEERAAALAAISFRHSARSFVEILLTGRFGRSFPRLKFAQPELWRALNETSRPVVAATAHLGAWELLASLLGELWEPPRPRMVVVRRYPDPAVQAFITARREARGARMIGHRTVASAVLKALRQNGIVAFLVDHNAMRSEALFLPFLDDMAAVNMGPALLGVRAGALIWPVFLLRDGEDYVVHLRPPLDTADLEGSREEKVRATARFYTEAVERMVREHPEQWFWMHNRWKTRPPESAPPVSD